MLATLRLGRVGPLTIYLNYTWLFVMALITWWVGLYWLPDNYPDWSPLWAWLVSIVVALLFLASVIAHELVHSLIARSASVTPRNANLYMFGAAVPFRFRDVIAGRILASAGGAIAFNMVVGGLLLWLGVGLPASGSFLSWLGAILVPLGLLNLMLGLVNLIPGIPFDGGWALAAASYLLSNDTGTGTNLARRIGWLAALVLIFVGAWQGLTNNSWPQSLALILVGWAAIEAQMVGQQRSTLRELLTEMTAADFMEATVAEAGVEETASVAELMKGYQKAPPNKPIPVLDAAGSLVGVTSAGKAEALLQGMWSSTPVRAITIPVAEAQNVRARTPLVEVLAMSEAHRDGGEETLDISVLDGDKLVGSINPIKLQSFEDAGRQFGLQESLGESAETGKQRAPGLLSTLIVVALVFVISIIAGNGVISARNDDTNAIGADPEKTLVFANFAPAEGQLVGLGQIDLSVEIEAASPIISATISVDGEMVDAPTIDSPALIQILTASVPGLPLGPHTVRVTATTASGEKGAQQWQFRVVSGAGPGPSPTAEPVAGNESLVVVSRLPLFGARLLAEKGSVTILLAVSGPEPQDAEIMLDGKSIAASITAGDSAEGAEQTYTVSASVPAVQAGRHEVNALITGSAGGTYSYQWTFSALKPDDNNAYFAETGYFVSQPFLEYWKTNGGLGLYGFPVSDLIRETDEVTGETYTAQYFERARFEQHPALGGQVLLGRLGVLVAEPEGAAQPQADAQFFPETGHNLSGAFLQYWNDRGGLAVFGYPITEPRTENNPIDGKDYTVQYFERARFELHPEMAGTPFEVQLGLLGVQIYDKLYSQTLP